MSIETYQQTLPFVSSGSYDCLLRLHEVFEDKEWRFAKTMPANPHWYSLSKTWQSRAEFEEAVRLIRQFGYKIRFGKSFYTLFNVGEYFYWTMGAPVHETTLINRAFIDKNTPHPYDAIAEKYDNLFSDARSRQEDDELGKKLRAWVSGRVLDIGCGTGLLLKLIDVDEFDYLGVDPSRGMLKKFSERHPSYQTTHCYYQDFPGSGFDRIISLYGSFNYVPPDVLHRVLHQLNAGGEYWLMFHKDDYHPITHSLSDTHIPYNKFSEYQLPRGSSIESFSNYLIVKGKK